MEPISGSSIAERAAPRGSPAATQARGEHAAERRIRPGLGACAHSERPGGERRYTNDCTHVGAARCHPTSSARGSDSSRATNSPGRASSHPPVRCTPTQNDASCRCTSSRYPCPRCSGEALRSAGEPIRLQLLRPWLQHLQPTSRHLQLLHVHSQLRQRHRLYGGMPRLHRQQERRAQGSVFAPRRRTRGGRRLSAPQASACESGRMR